MICAEPNCNVPFTHVCKHCHVHVHFTGQWIHTHTGSAYCNAYNQSKNKQTAEPEEVNE